VAQIVKRGQSTIDYLLGIVFSVLTFVHAQGGSIGDLDLIWFPNSDLTGWYLRSLAFTTEGVPSFTSSLAFPQTFDTNWGWNSFDLLQVAIQWLLAKLGANPIIATNLLVLFMVGLTAGSAVFAFKRLGTSRLFTIFGALLLSTLPFTFFRSYHPNIAFGWPYILCCVASLGITESLRLRVWAYFVIGLMIGASGSYAILFCMICLGPVLIVVLVGRFSDRARQLTRVGVLFSGAVVSVLVYLALLSMWKPTNTDLDIFNFRDPSEARFWQGWMITNFLPGPTSGIPLLREVFELLNTWLYPALDPTPLCPAEWNLEGLVAEWGCIRLIEGHSLNSIASLLGNWLVLSTIFILIVARIDKSNGLMVQGPIRKALTNNRSILTLILLWCTVSITYSFGLGLLIARVMPGARSWGRMSLLLSVVAVLVAVILLDSLLKSREISKFRRLILVAISLTLFADQVNFKFDSLPITRPLQRQYADFADAIRNQLPKNCGVALIPSQRYARGISTFEYDYTPTSDLFLSLYVPTLRWSSGLIQEDFGGPWPPLNSLQTELERQLYFNDFVRTGLNLGVCGFVIDRSRGSGISDWDETFLRSELRKFNQNYRVIRRTNLTSLIVVGN
jgi:hypothetical protein